MTDGYRFAQPILRTARFQGAIHWLGKALLTHYLCCLTIPKSGLTSLSTLHAMVPPAPYLQDGLFRVAGGVKIRLRLLIGEDADAVVSVRWIEH